MVSGAVGDGHPGWCGAVPCGGVRRDRMAGQFTDVMRLQSATPSAMPPSMTISCPVM
jgi:hypothetical protein